jgi:hypothetical protein
MSDESYYDKAEAQITQLRGEVDAANNRCTVTLVVVSWLVVRLADTERAMDDLAPALVVAIEAREKAEAARDEALKSRDGMHAAMCDQVDRGIADARANRVSEYDVMAMQRTHRTAQAVVAANTEMALRAPLPAHRARHTPEELASLVKSACATYDEMVRLLREVKKDYWCKPGLDDGKPCGSKGCQSCSIAALLATLEGKP